MKEEIASPTDLALNKMKDWSRAAAQRSKSWYDDQRAKYAERRLVRKPEPAQQESEGGPGKLKRFWYALRIASRFYPSTQQAPAATPGVAMGDITDAILCRSISPRVHALLRFRAAMRIGAAAVAEQHAAVCRVEGWADEQMEAAAVGYDSPAFSEDERLLLRYADDLSRTPMDIDISVVRQLRQHFSEDQLLEVAASICQENFKARFATAISSSRSRAQAAVA